MAFFLIIWEIRDYMGDTGSAGQGEPEVFFVFKKPFALRLRLI